MFVCAWLSGRPGSPQRFCPGNLMDLKCVSTHACADEDKIGENKFFQREMSFSYLVPPHRTYCRIHVATMASEFLQHLLEPFRASALKNMRWAGRAERIIYRTSWFSGLHFSLFDSHDWNLSRIFLVLFTWTVCPTWTGICWFGDESLIGDFVLSLWNNTLNVCPVNIRQGNKAFWALWDNIYECACLLS